MKNCSLSCGGQRRSASAWSMQQRCPDVGDVAKRRLAPELLDARGRSGSPRSATRLYSGPVSELAQSETWFVTPFSETAARKRSVVPTSQLTMNPP